MTSAPAIGFEYQPSRLFARLRAAIVLLALLAIALCGVSLAVRLMLGLAVVALFVWSRRRGAGTRLVAAGLDQHGVWSLHYDDGSDTLASLHSSRVLGPFVLLHLALGRRRETLLLGPDNSEADIRRRLRMRLAAGAATAPAEAPH